VLVFWLGALQCGSPRDPLKEHLNKHMDHAITVQARRIPRGTGRPGGEEASSFWGLVGPGGHKNHTGRKGAKRPTLWLFGEVDPADRGGAGGAGKGRPREERPERLRARGHLGSVRSYEAAIAFLIAAAVSASYLCHELRAERLPASATAAKEFAGVHIVHFMDAAEFPKGPDTG